MNFDFETQLKSLEKSFELSACTNTLISEKNSLIISNLKCVSFHLNKSPSAIECSDCISYSTLKILNILFERCVSRMEEKLDDEDLSNKILRHIVTIMSKFSIKHFRLLAHEGMFENFLKFFRNKCSLVYLFEASILTLIKLLNIFSQLCKVYAYFDIHKQLSEDEITILVNTREQLDILSKSDDRFCHIKPLTHIYLIAACYLQKRLHSSGMILVGLKHFATFHEGFIQNYFKQIRDDFASDCELVEYECLNELNQYEIVKTHKFKEKNMRHVYETFLSLSPFVMILESIRLRSSTNEMKLMSFEIYKNTFKSILFYGLDIERVFCLRCLNEFCQGNASIKSQLMSDEMLIKFLLKVYQRENDKASLKERLRLIVEIFLA